MKEESRMENTPVLTKEENPVMVKNEDDVLVPDFSVKLQLDPALYKKLKSSKELVVAAYYFYKIIDDDQKVNADLQKHLDGNQLEILTGKTEESQLSQPEITFHFKGLALPKKLENAAPNTTLHLNINFFSGRKAFEDNIMDAELLDVPFEKVLHSTGPLILKAKLLPSQH